MKRFFSPDKKTLLVRFVNLQKKMEQQKNSKSNLLIEFRQLIEEIKQSKIKLVLNGMRFTEWHFSETNFDELDFSGAVFINCQFSKCSFLNAKFNRCYIEACKFEKCIAYHPATLDSEEKIFTCENSRIINSTFQEFNAKNSTWHMSYIDANFENSDTNGIKIFGGYIKSLKFSGEKALLADMDFHQSTILGITISNPISLNLNNCLIEQDFWSKNHTLFSSYDSVGNPILQGLATATKANMPIFIYQLHDTDDKYQQLQEKLLQLSCASDQEATEKITQEIQNFIIKEEVTNFQLLNLTPVNLDFLQINLENLNFEMADLSGIQLTNHSIYNSTFRQAYLLGTNLSENRFEKVDFSYVLAMEANFSSHNNKITHITDSTFYGSCIKGANFCGISVSGLDLRNAALNDSKWGKVTQDKIILSEKILINKK